VSEQSFHPAEDALFSFQPQADRIDKVLFDGIVDDDQVIRANMGSMPHLTGNVEGLGEDEFHELIDEDDYASIDSSEADASYNIGGRQGFQTNIDDFLLKFGSFADSERALHKSRTSRLKQPLIFQTDSRKDDSVEQGSSVKYTFKQEELR